MKKHWSYSEASVANMNDHKGLLWLNLRNTDVSLLLRRWSLMILWRDIFDTLTTSMATFLILMRCVNVWICDVSLLLHWWFVDDSLKIHWRYSEDFDASINDLQGLFWPNLRNIDVSLLLRRWSLMILWREIFETLITSMATFLILLVCVVLTSESLMFHCFFIDDSLMIEDTLTLQRRFRCKY